MSHMNSTIKLFVDNSKDVNGNNGLHVAVNNNYVQLVKKFVSNESLVNNTNIHGQTPFHFAIEKNNYTIINVLIENDADPEIGKIEKPIHIAAKNGFTSTVETLVLIGANYHCVNSENKTPLYLAVQNNHYSTAKLLLKCGADPTFMLEYQESMLVHACKNKNRDLVKLLIDYGLSPNVTYLCGMTVLGKAIMDDDIEIAYHLLLSGADKFIDANQTITIEKALPNIDDKIKYYMKNDDYRPLLHSYYPINTQTMIFTLLCISLIDDSTLTLNYDILEIIFGFISFF